MTGCFQLNKKGLMFAFPIMLIWLILSSAGEVTNSISSKKFVESDLHGNGHLSVSAMDFKGGFLKNNINAKYVDHSIQNKIHMTLTDEQENKWIAERWPGHQVPAEGQIFLIQNFPSVYVNPRNIEIWLPESYDPGKKYAVIYAHDGQMLYDKTKSWNQQAWDIDDVAGEMMRSGKIKDLIVVGIWNDGINRFSEYFPQQPFKYLSESEKSEFHNAIREKFKFESSLKIKSDNYLKFIVKELKPWVDSHYPTLKDPQNTIVLGSSMGGLISLYAITKYPHVFGKAVCMSTHWPGIVGMEINPIPNAFLKYIDQTIGKLRKHKIFFDLGDQGLDSLYGVTQLEVDKLMHNHGFTPENWQTLYISGGEHNETSWNKRLPAALEFIMK
jgi:predicted alpha/beta superfamily hydrolase